MEAFYEDNNRKRFKFPLCVPILHALPKFDPFAGGDDEQEEDGNHIGTVMGSSLERPIGSKAAKQLKKEAISNNNEMKEIKEEFQGYVAIARRQEAFEEMIKTCKYYRSIGEMDLYKEANEELQALIKANRLAREEEKKKRESTMKTPDVPSVVACEEVVDCFTVLDNGRVQGVMLPPDDSSEFTDALLERSNVVAEKRRQRLLQTPSSSSGNNEGGSDAASSEEAYQQKQDP